MKMLYESVFVILLCSFQLSIEAASIKSGNNTSQYHCLGLFECPATSHDVIFPPGNLTSGYTFTEKYFEGVCQYIKELADCTVGVNLDYTECGYVESILFGYRQFYFTMCSNTSPLKYRLIQLIPCMNSHSLQLDTMSLINMLIGKLSLMSTLPSDAKITSDAEKGTILSKNDISCRSVYEFTEEASQLDKDMCGAEYGNIIYMLLEGVASVTEKTIGFGCDDII